MAAEGETHLRLIVSKGITYVAIPDLALWLRRRADGWVEPVDGQVTSEKLHAYAHEARAIESMITEKEG